MKIYKYTIWITLAFTVLSIICACYLQFMCVEKEFWINVSLSIFGSSFLTMLTSIIGYLIFKKRYLEDFFMDAVDARNQIFKILYIEDMSIYNKLKGIENEDIFDNRNTQLEELKKRIEKVIYSYLSVSINMIVLSKDYINIDFLIKNRSFRNWIHESVYTVISEYDNLINDYKNEFQSYLDNKEMTLQEIYKILIQKQNNFFRFETVENEESILIYVYNDALTKLDSRIEQLRSKIYNQKEKSNPVSSKLVHTILKK